MGLVRFGSVQISDPLSGESILDVRSGLCPLVWLSDLGSVC